MQAEVASGPIVDDARESLHLEQLGSESFDLKQWINTSLQSLSIFPATGDGDAVLEARLGKLYSTLQLYSQEVAGSVDETIAQSLVRLPRTGLEVSRMTAEAQQLEQQLRFMQEATQPVVEETIKPYVARLGEMKKAREKLARCADTLRVASEVDGKMKQLDEMVQSLRAAPSEEDPGAVAVCIRQVRRDLENIKAFDFTFGERQLEKVKEYEQLVEREVEAECMGELRRHGVERAVHLLGILDAIGRADAVLKQFVTECAASEKANVERLLGCGGGSGAEDGVSPAGAAAILEKQLIPSIARALNHQFDYLLHLEVLAKSGADHDTKNTLEAGARTADALCFMVDQITGCIETVLKPILVSVGRGAELVACIDAVCHLQIGAGVTATELHYSEENCTDNSGSKIGQLVTAHAKGALMQLFDQPEMLETFAQLETSRVESLVGDSDCAVGRAHFRLVVDKLVEAVMNTARFFPHKTLPMCIGRWRSAVLQCIPVPEPTTGVSRYKLLEQLYVARRVAPQQLLLAQKGIAEYLKSPGLRGQDPEVVEMISQQLEELLWTPLNEAVECSAKQHQEAVKQTIIAPVIANTDGYESQAMWGCGGREVNARPAPATPARYARAQTAPSDIVRRFGESIVEIPLALEALRGDGETRSEGFEDLLEEMAEPWLDDIVRRAVVDFLDRKVGTITIHFPTSDGAEEAAAMEQLVEDLSYLRAILAAVSDVPFERLERALAQVKTISPRPGEPLILRHLLV
uniref:Conserved oligomeric Golgi complex subunit 7 n=1 Tax=Trypanosoma vivax (strain Y486) TaxID=1055687 RepID=G0TXI1_TRYVY|nr:conserved hypothetical protein [Trypanosoma vivax Y486]